jgi:Copine
MVELSKYPVSVIIIGVGDESFENMRRLDGDKERLRSSKGVLAIRDIVQFVKLTDYCSAKDGMANMSGLAEEVLKELPDQIIDYMATNKIKPNIIPQD